MLKAPGAGLCQNACGVVNKQKIFCLHQCSPDCSMNKFTAYISTDTFFIIYIYNIYIYIYYIPFTTKQFFEVAAESWPEGDLNLWALNFVQML